MAIFRFSCNTPKPRQKSGFLVFCGLMKVWFFVSKNMGVDLTRDGFCGFEEENTPPERGAERISRV